MANIYGDERLGAALNRCRIHLIGVAVFSALLNLLFLVPMLYMLQVYDRVVPTRGVETLLMLTLVLLFGLATMALLDCVRSRLLVRASIRLDHELAGALLHASLRCREGTIDAVSRQAMRELDSLRQAITGPVLLALLDAPWALVWVLVCSIIHPALGLLVLVGGGSLGLITLLNERSTGTRLRSAQLAAARAYAAQEQVLASAETVRALGMRQAMVERHVGERREMMGLQIGASLSSSRYVAFSKFLRFALQSLALGLGAWLAVEGRISAGAIFAASFLTGRALGPLEGILAAWPTILRARSAYDRLGKLLASGRPDLALTRLPDPAARLAAEQLSIVRAGGGPRVLVNVSVTAEPGEVVAIVGPSGAGKSTLLRALAGAIQPDAGFVRLDGARLADWEADRLGRLLGYLPQETGLFAGTIRDNIARFAAPDAQSDALVMEAARAASAHEMILRLPSGYDTTLDWGGSGLSAGQAQRVGLARALYGNPAVLLLDEPNAHLDSDGEAELLDTIRAAKKRGTAVIIVSHRSAVLTVTDKVLLLRDGAVEAFGARDEVLTRLRLARPAPIKTPEVAAV